MFGELEAAGVLSGCKDPRPLPESLMFQALVKHLGYLSFTSNTDFTQLCWIYKIGFIILDKY